MMAKFLAATLILFLSVVSYGEETDSRLPVAALSSAPAPQPVAVTNTTENTVKLAENQIPLSIAADKKTSENSSTTKALASGLIVMVLLGVSYHYVRKYKTSNHINKSNMQIKVLTQHYLGPKKSLAIIHVAGESILVGITDTNISMIKSLSLIDDEVPAEMPKTFNESMAQKEKQTDTTAGELEEEFSFAGVSDTVSRKIKSMRSFS